MYIVSCMYIIFCVKILQRSNFFNEFLSMQIVWSPWLWDASVPDYINRCNEQTKKRLLLVSEREGAWYLGEQVTRQSLGTPEQCIPKPPPLSMLLHYVKTIKYNIRSICGQSALKYITRQRKETYKQFFSNLVTRLLQINNICSALLIILTMYFFQLHNNQLLSYVVFTEIANRIRTSRVCVNYSSTTNNY